MLEKDASGDGNQLVRTLVLAGVAVLFGLVVEQTGVVRDGQLTYVAVGITLFGLVLWLWQR